MKTLVAVLLLTVGAGAAVAEEKSSTLSLAGTGSVKAKPDECYVQLGVVTEGKTSTEAMKSNNEAMRNVYNSLGKFAITEENVRTVSFAIQPRYKVVKEGKEEKNVQDGFYVVNMVQVTVCHFEKTGEILDALVSAGANQVQSIRFGSSKAKEHLQEARKLAVREAVEKALVISKELGVLLGRPVSVSESMPFNRFEGGYERSAAAPGADVPVSGGSLTFSVNVNVTWELK